MGWQDEAPRQPIGSLVSYLVVLYVFVPMVLLLFAHRKSTGASIGVFPASGALVGVFTLLALVPTARWLAWSQDILLLVSTMLLFSFMKMLRVLMGHFHPSVVEGPDKFLLFFLIPSEVSFCPSQHVRIRGIRRLAVSMGEFLLSAVAYYATLWLVKTFPSLSGYQRAMYLPETIIVYLHIRVFLNGVLLGGTELLHGDGIEMEETWRNLAAANSLQGIWRGWNTGVHDSLLLCSYLPLRRSLQTYALSRTAAAIASMGLTFFLSGLLHEAVIWVRTGSCGGSQLLFFMLQFLGILIERLLWSRVPDKSFRWSREVLGRFFLYAWLALTLPAFMSEVGPPVAKFFPELQLAWPPQ